MRIQCVLSLKSGIELPTFHSSALLKKYIRFLVCHARAILVAMYYCTYVPNLAHLKILNVNCHWREIPMYCQKHVSFVRNLFEAGTKRVARTPVAIAAYIRILLIISLYTKHQNRKSEKPIRLSNFKLMVPLMVNTRSARIA